MSSASVPAMKTILLINPNTSQRTLEMMVDAAIRAAPAGFRIVGAKATRGVDMIVNAEDLEAAKAEVVRIGSEAHCDGIIVAAFGGPGADELAGSNAKPVIGIGQAAMQQAARGGKRFAVVTTTPELKASIEEQAKHYGLAEQLVAVRITNGDPLALSANPAAQEKALFDTADACFEQDKADTIVIGGGPLNASAEALCRHFGNRIVAPVPAAIAYMVQALR